MVKVTYGQSLFFNILKVKDLWTPLTKDHTFSEFLAGKSFAVSNHSSNYNFASATPLSQ